MKINAVFAESQAKFEARLDGREQQIKAELGEVKVVTEYVGGELYDGDYAVTPKVEAQTMPTKGKVMSEDVTIRSIPIYRTSNTAGGNTVYIAKEM